MAAFATWLTVRVLQVRSDLEAASAQLAGVRIDDAVDARSDPAAWQALQTKLAGAAADTASARVRTSDPLWHLAERLPWVGDDLAAVRVLTVAGDTTVSKVGVPLSALAAAIDPAALRRPDGSLDLSGLAAGRRELTAAESAALSTQQSLRSLDRASLTRPVRSAVDEVSSLADRLVPVTQALARTARLAPALLGSDGPRRYLLAFQNPAEARGTGGIVGFYAVVEADAGRVRLTATGANDDLAVLDAPPADLGAEYQNLYGSLSRDSDNANLSPHFPYAAQNLLGLWAKQTGERLDGVVAVDPVALSALLRVLGPVELGDGETVTASNVVPLTLSEVYRRFDEQAERRVFLASLVSSLFERFSGPGADPVDLVKALREPVAEHRVLVYSAHEQEQEDLARTELAGALPPADGSVRAVVVDNAGANKLDFYLGRTVRYEIGCTSAGRTRTTLSVQLHNGAPPMGLPRYVTSHAPSLASSPSTNRLIVSVFVPAPTGLVGVTLDGATAGGTTGTQLGYDVFSTTVDVPAGQTVTLVWSLDEPAVPDDARLRAQPLVLPADQQVQHVCST